VARPGRKESASASGIPGAKPAAVAAGLTAARSRRPAISATVANGASSAGSAEFFRCDRRRRSIGQRGSQRYMIRRIRHLHFPTGRLAAAAAQQLDTPPRIPYPRLSPSWQRRERGNAPASYGGVRQSALARRLPTFAPAPQQKGGDAGAFRGEL